MKKSFKLIKFFSYILAPLVGIFLPIAKVGAVCPVCTIAVGASLGLSRWVGVYDTISGLWIGGLIVSTTLWTYSWMKKRHYTFPGDLLVVALVYYTSILIPLYYTEILGHPLNKIWGIDKLIFGLAVGSIFFLAGDLTYAFLKKRHGGRAYFAFQKIVMPILPLALLTVVFYFVTRK